MHLNSKQEELLKLINKKLRSEILKTGDILYYNNNYYYILKAGIERHEVLGIFLHPQEHYIVNEYRSNKELSLWLLVTDKEEFKILCQKYLLKLKEALKNGIEYTDFGSVVRSDIIVYDCQDNKFNALKVSDYSITFWNDLEECREIKYFTNPRNISYSKNKMLNIINLLEMIESKV